MCAKATKHVFQNWLQLLPERLFEENFFFSKWNFSVSFFWFCTFFSKIFSLTVCLYLIGTDQKFPPQKINVGYYRKLSLGHIFFNNLMEIVMFFFFQYTHTHDCSVLNLETMKRHC